MTMRQVLQDLKTGRIGSLGKSAGGSGEGQDAGRRTENRRVLGAKCEKSRAEVRGPSGLRRPVLSSVARLFRCFHGCPGATHQAWMQNTELGDLSMRCCRRHPEPVFVEWQFEGRCEIELRGIAQSRNGVGVAVRIGDDEFTGKELVHLLACAVSHLHPGGCRLFPYFQDQSWPRLWPRLQRCMLRKLAPDDVPRFWPGEETSRH